jgi:hypothetical protein
MFSLCFSAPFPGKPSSPTLRSIAPLIDNNRPSVDVAQLTVSYVQSAILLPDFFGKES